MSAELQRLIGKAVTDENFRNELLNDPSSTAKNEGLNDQDAAQIEEAVKKVLASLTKDEINKQFGTSAAAYWN
jgi:hypothetical protein